MVAASGWYKPAVDFAQASGLMSGMGDNKFAPDVTTTRAMVAQVMYELADEPDVSGLTCPLSDVDSTAWYADAVIWAYNAGVVSGYEDGTFRPGRAITRQEMAVMFYGMLFGTDSILAEDDIKPEELGGEGPVCALGTLYFSGDVRQAFARLPAE